MSQKGENIMIYTITFNPALDYISQVDNFEVGKINRTKTEEILSGGKGLNVSTVLSNLGIESTALGFIAGFTGEELKKNIEEKGIKTDFINVKKGITRINVKISSKEETALNGNGPEITEENIKELIEKIDGGEEKMLALVDMIRNENKMYINMGRKEGIKEGKKQTYLEIAKNLLKLKMPISQISEITKLPKEEIEKYK